MTALFQEIVTTSCSINQEIQNHLTWHGDISGLKAEKMLRECKQPYTYLLRAGENQDQYSTDYYVTFVSPDFSIKHQPFVITLSPLGWHYENYSAGGPFTNASIDDVIHLIMHCNIEQSIPYAAGTQNKLFSI